MTLRSALLSACGLYCIAAAAPPAMAQTASQIIPPSFAPAPPQAKAPLVIVPGAGAQAPAGAAVTEVRVGDVTVEGAALSPERLAALRAQLTGRAIKVSDIFAAARALEADYARSGYVLVRVTVPPQSLADGATVKLVVVRGYIERIDVSAVPARLRPRVAALLAGLEGNRDVTFVAIERRLLLAGDTAGLNLRSTLAPGGPPGATILVIDGEHHPVTAFASVDNTLPPELGRYAYGLGVNFNSVLGLGETIYLRASGLPTDGSDTGFFAATPRDRSLAAGAIIPLANNGLDLTIEGTDARTAARHDPALPGFASHFQRLSGRLSYPVVLRRDLRVSVQTTFDAQEETSEAIYPVFLPLSLDRLRIFRLASDMSAALPAGGVMNGRVEASFGLNALGARTAADATPTLPLSRLGSDAAFKKLAISVRLDQPLARDFGLNLRLQAQTAFGHALSNSEQIGIATMDGVSPLGAGGLQGDDGYVMRGELRRSFRAGDSGLLVPYAFAALGGVHLAQPTAVERRSTGAAAYGAGLRVSGFTSHGAPGLSASVEYGRAHVDGRPGEADRVSFTLIHQF